MKTLTVLLTLFGVLLILGGTHPHPARAEGADDSHDESSEHSEIVRLTPEELREFAIRTTPAAPGPIAIHIDVPGEVQPNASRLAHIVPRFAGIVTEVHADLGDRVQSGQVLAIVESDKSLAPFEMKTLLGGTVIERHVTLGEGVDRGTVAYVVSDLSSVWIELQVFQRDLDRVQIGQSTSILVGHEMRATGRIDYITPVLDEASRSATARVVLDNSDGRWRPGMFVTGHILVDERPADLVVERAALQNYENRTVVFVETDEGFVPRPVEIGRMDNERAEILSGLERGEGYVSQGAFTLKAELAKESFGDGDGH